MEQITKQQNYLGSVEFYGDMKKNFFLACPHGVANPSLLREDVDQARKFAAQCNAPWTYFSNTEDVVLVNPFNLFYLKEVKKIRHLKRIVIFAPNPFHRLLLKLVSKVVRPDTIVTSKKEFERMMDHSS